VEYLTDQLNGAYSRDYGYDAVVFENSTGPKIRH